MRVLLSTESFASFAGTETYVLSTAIEFERLGHDVAVYAPEHGAIADVARAQGVRVLSRRALPAAVELVIASDAATCHELAGRYRDSVRLFVAHSADYALQAPPQLEDRVDAVVVMNDRVRRVVEARASHPPLVRLHQPIDLMRFATFGTTGSPSRTALVLSNYVEGTRFRLVEAACKAAGLSVARVGRPAGASPDVELAIAEADIVIGLGRSVLEGMAAGRAAYVYGVVGGDGWVTPERYPAMEADGFAGTGLPDVIIDQAALTEDLGNWNERMGEVNRDLASAHHSMRDHAAALVKLARELEVSSAPPPSVEDELAHLVRLQWQSECRAMLYAREIERLRAAHSDERERLLGLAAEAEQRAANADAVARDAARRVDAIRRSRRYRLASRLTAPLDRLRGR